MNAPMMFAGVDGLRWANRVETLALDATVSADVPWRDEVGYIEALRRTAARALTDKIISEAASHREQELPGGMGTKHTWTVSFVMPDDGHNWFADQIERERESARTAALAEAADYLLGRARFLRSARINETVAAGVVEGLSEQVRHLPTPRHSQA